MKLLFVLLAFFLSSCKPKLATILSVDPNISTIYSINKEDFINYFGDEVKMKEIDSSELIRIIKTLNPSDSNKDIDVRALIIIENDTIAVNRFNLKIGEKKFIMNIKLHKIIWGS